MRPEVAAVRLLWAVYLGAFLALAYGFLRPLGSRAPLLRDLLFLPLLWGTGLFLGFGICRGDLRLGVLVCLGAGFLLWDGTAGILLSPLFSLIWKGLGKTLSFFALPLKIFLGFAKKCFATSKK